MLLMNIVMIVVGTMYNKCIWLSHLRVLLVGWPEIIVVSLVSILEISLVLWICQL